MKISYIYNTIKTAMNKLEGVDCITMIDKRTQMNNQSKIHEAYNILDKLKEEMIRESIKRSNTNY